VANTVMALCKKSLSSVSDLQTSNSEMSTMCWSRNSSYI